MTELIKQRLVGMLIVVLAGVVFIPDLLDGQKSTIKEDFKKIPPRPESSESPILKEFPMAQVQDALKQAPQPTIEVAEEDKAELEQDEAISAIASAEDQTTVEQQIAAEPELASVTAGRAPQFDSSAWVLRLGTFRNKPNVDALLTKLEEAGVTTFVKPVEAKAGTLYRVFVGPELEKSELEKAQKKLKELTGLDGKITEFTPVN